MTLIGVSSHSRILKSRARLTKRAPDAGDSVAIASSFLRISLFLAGRLRRPRPSAGNANPLGAEKLKVVKNYVFKKPRKIHTPLQNNLFESRIDFRNHCGDKRVLAGLIRIPT